MANEKARFNFGQHICKADAQRMYLNFFKIKERTNDLMRQSLAGDAEALRYHAGKFDTTGAAGPDGQFPCSFLDMAFVFERAAVEALLKDTSEGKKPDGVILFLGARNMEDSLGQAPDDEGNMQTCYLDVDGRPTIIAFPFTYETKPNLKTGDGAELAIALDDGQEHPGTGGDGGDSGGSGGGGTVSFVTDSGIVALKEGTQPAGTTLPIPRQIPATFSSGRLEHLETR
ncbi:MAG TPA: hypothetical protein VL978_02855 [Puia sp.]|nr:hypothetical protein [Puia sp.]